MCCSRRDWGETVAAALTAKARTGILGGTFDPVHIGHLVAAVCVRHSLALDRVLLVVANEPWQKVGSRDVTGAEHRFTVVSAAVEGVAGVEASRIEIERGGPSYTADTVAELRDRVGGQLYLIVGSDLVGDLDSWERVHEVRDSTTLVIVERGGVPRAPDRDGPEGDGLERDGLERDGLERDGWRVERVSMPSIDLSSSELRARFADGRPVDFLIPAPAINMIRRLGLYAGGRVTGDPGV
jgi:nicotinate-nucleotide adenylyltransferase